MNHITLVLVPLILALGCASASLQVVRPLQQPVRKVSLSLETTGSAAMTDEQMSRLRTTLTSSLVSSGISVVPKGRDGAASLDGVIDQYDPGNRALRACWSLRASRLFDGNTRGQLFEIPFQLLSSPMWDQLVDTVILEYESEPRNLFVVLNVAKAEYAKVTFRR